MARFLWCLLPVLFELSYALPPQKIRFDGHKVLEILHDTEDGLKNIIDLGHKFEVDWWNLPRGANDSLHLRVHPHKFENFTSEIQKIGAKVNVFIEDIQSLIDQEPFFNGHHLTKRATARSSGYNVDSAYHNYDSILRYLDHVASSTLPDSVTATKINIGHTYEGRQVELLHLTRPTTRSSKKTIFIDGGIHAREWIAPATILYFIEQLAYNPSRNPVISTILEHFDFYLLPVVNPDGYEYTHINRLWRKNRRVTSGSCYGVDLNRNFPFQWNPSVGGSIDPCNEIYSGPYAGSELETQNLVNFLHGTHTHDIVAYLTIHSYGQMWLYPWGYTSKLPSDYRDLGSMARKATRALKGLFHTTYDIGSSTNVLYPAAGGSDDYAKGGAGIKYAYTVELRDRGTYGFVLPTNLIKPTIEETFEGLKAFATSIASHEGW